MHTIHMESVSDITSHSVRSFKSFQLRINQLQRNSASRCAKKAMNDALGPKELLPSALVFEEFLHFRASTELEVTLDLKERASIARKGQEEMSRHMAKLGIQRPLNHQALPTGSTYSQVRDKVLVRREDILGN